VRSLPRSAPHAVVLRRYRRICTISAASCRALFSAPCRIERSSSQRSWWRCDRRNRRRVDCGRDVPADSSDDGHGIRLRLGPRLHPPRYCGELWRLPCLAAEVGGASCVGARQVRGRYGRLWRYIGLREGSLLWSTIHSNGSIREDRGPPRVAKPVRERGNAYV
jgi:hypothetical protein